MKFVKLSGFIISILLLISVSYYGYWHNKVLAPLQIESETLVHIGQGDTAYGILKHWQQQGWINLHRLDTKLWIKTRLKDRQIRKGTYQLDVGVNIDQAFDLFISGNELATNIVLVEGLTLDQWIEQIRNHPYLVDDISHDSLKRIRALWPAEFGEPLVNLEGVLLADTYKVTYGTKASDLLERALNAMTQFLNAQWQKRQPLLPYENTYQSLIMASIVEKETALASERALIAGVFVNRLNDRMRLQTDPTVIYGLGKRFDGNLTRAHLREKNAYNTYVIKGLPPTPIAMAGREAIKASLHPQDTQAYYFVAKGDGSHYFSSNLEEHNQAVQQYQLKKK